MIYLQSLHITSSYKLLKDFKIDFQALQPKGYSYGLEWLTVLLGNNGSGKSSVLEAMTYIFRGLHEFYLHGKEPDIPFNFQMNYLVSSTTTEWVSLPSMPNFPLPLPRETEETATKYTDVSVTGASGLFGYTLSIEELTGLTKKGVVQRAPVPELRIRELLPNLVIYYAGVSESIRSIYLDYEREVLNESRISAVDKALSEATALPLYYLQAEDIGLLLASLYSFEFNLDLQEFLSNILRMEKPQDMAVTLVIKPPKYGNKAVNNYENGWKSQGVLGSFLAQLRDKVSYVAPLTGQNMYSLHFNLNDWYRLREAYSSERELFALLLLLKANNMVVSASVNFIRDGLVLAEDALSEGEQQLLVVRALAELLVLNNEGTILLFDEPDTFLHPKWQEEYFKTLEPIKERAACVITTHSPILLAQMEEGRIIELAEGSVRFSERAPYGQRYADTLRNFMLEKPRPADVYEEFNQMFQLIDRKQLDDAMIILNKLRERPGPEDSDVIRAERMINFLSTSTTTNALHSKGKR